ncbi:MAG: pyridoxal-phosphate dependent enzyme [Haloarculaceae archaeon]
MYECADCGREFAADGPWRCACGGPLEFATRPDLPSGPPDALDRDRGLWAVPEFLPVDRRVTLGEGWTPLVEASGWDAAFKLDYCFPTGSFKDRGAAVLCSLADRLGVERALEDSSGNAGAAIATYAARAGIDATIYVPADAKAGKLRAIERTGATLERVSGDRHAVTEACQAAVEAGEGWYASHAWHPGFFAGTATVALEVAAQRDWTAPDVFVTPLGHGTLFLGAYRGFRALAEAGWIDEVPRLIGAQAAGVAPIAAAVRGDGNGNNDVADGIQVRQPARREQILDAIDATDGTALAVDADATERTLNRLHRRGFQVEPTCAVAPAALETLRKRGEVAPDDDVVVALTGLDK